MSRKVSLMGDPRSEQPTAEIATARIRSVHRNMIAVIGIDHYRYCRTLTNAVRDATSTAALFQRLGFEQAATPLLDDHATGQAIQSLVTDDLLLTLGEEDSLVIFYAGHGATRKRHLGGQVIKTGYLLPVDALDAPDKVSTWIDLEGWLRAVSLLPARHILVILDACYSGIALDPIIKWRDITSWQDTPMPILQERRSRRIITSALDDQLALDSGPMYGHSLFTGCLIEGLTHGLRQADNRATTGSELGLYIQRRVKEYPNSQQTPDFGTFAFDDRGEMAIPLAIEQPQDDQLTSATNSTASLATSSIPPSDNILSKDDRHQTWRWIFLSALGAILTVVLGTLLTAKFTEGHLEDSYIFNDGSPLDVRSIDAGIMPPEHAIDAGSMQIGQHDHIEQSSLSDLDVELGRPKPDRSADTTSSHLVSQTHIQCPMEMVSISAATFRMGSTRRIGAEDEHAQHDVTLSAYCIDKTEVTVRQYAACVNAKGCVAESFTDNWGFHSNNELKFYNQACNRDDRANHPINCIDWNEAVTFCAWAGKRLPTEAEWEYAARGGDGRFYPWGNSEPNATHVNACGAECSTAADRLLDEDWMMMYATSDGWVTTAPVGTFPKGASPFGLLDMAGNVEEWTADRYGGNYPEAAVINPHGTETGSDRVVRGGAWNTHISNYLRTAHRDSFAPTTRMSTLGFRCARSK